MKQNCFREKEVARPKRSFSQQIDRLPEYRILVHEAAFHLDKLLALDLKKLPGIRARIDIQGLGSGLPSDTAVLVDAAVARNTLGADRQRAKILELAWTLLEGKVGENAIPSLLTEGYGFTEKWAKLSAIYEFGKSPDKAEREGVDFLMGHFADLPPEAIFSLVPLLKKAKKRRGRRNRGSKLVNDEAAILKMIPLIVNEEKAIRPAADIVLQELDTPEQSFESDRRRLEDRWAKRLKTILAR